MGYLADEVFQQRDLQRLWLGRIAAAPQDNRDLVSVIIPGLEGKLRWEDCRWQPRGDCYLPKRDDPCIVAMDDNTELWVVAWWPKNAPQPTEGYQLEREINDPDGYAGLDGNGYVFNANLPLRLQEVGPLSPSDNANLAVNNGWYCTTPSTANIPMAEWGALEVHNITWTGASRQIWHRNGSYETWHRYQAGAGAYSTWRQMIAKPEWDTGSGLQDGWANVAGGYMPWGYRKSGYTVHVAGIIYRGSAPGSGSLIGILPAGFRPSYTNIFACACESGVARVHANPDGSIVYVSVLTSGSAYPQTWLSLAGITFAADQ